MKVVAISAGVGTPSSTQMLAERLARATGADEVQEVELRLFAHDLVNAMLTRVQSPQLQQVVRDVVDADALVVVTPVFNASFAGLFKLFFDVLHEGALLDKPVLLGATGGTERHSLAIDQAMLPLFFYLKAAVAPTAVFAATDDWAGGSLDRRIQRAGQELAAMVRVRQGEQGDELAEASQQGDALEGGPRTGQPGTGQPGRGHKAHHADADDFTLEKDFAQMMADLEG